MLHVPKIMPRLEDSQDWHTVVFIIVKGYKSKSAEGIGTWGKVWRKPGANVQESFSVESYRSNLNPSAGASG